VGQGGWSVVFLDCTLRGNDYRGRGMTSMGTGSPQPTPRDDGVGRIKDDDCSIRHLEEFVTKQSSGNQDRRESRL